MILEENINTSFQSQEKKLIIMSDVNKIHAFHAGHTMSKKYFLLSTNIIC